VGASKLARAVELFARRPEVQERLTEEIASFLDSRLQRAGVMIVV
jgi:GTP cyclohydrolase I